MAVTIQNQNFGVEIELTGITRETAAKTIADYYGTRSLYAGGSYHTYTAADNKGRIWKAMSDSSIHPTRMENERRLEFRRVLFRSWKTKGDCRLQTIIAVKS